MLHLKCCRLSIKRFPFFQLCLRLHLSLQCLSATSFIFYFAGMEMELRVLHQLGESLSVGHITVFPNVTLPTIPWLADASLGPAVSPCFSHLRHCCSPGAHRPDGLHILSHLTVPASTPNCLPPMVCHSFICVFLSVIARTAGCV